MSEQNPHTPTPEEAQDLAHAAIEFGTATNTILHRQDYRVNNKGVFSRAHAEAGSGAFNREVQIDYKDLALDPDATRPSGKRHTRAYVRVRGGTQTEYETELQTGDTSALARLKGTDGREATALLNRSGYGTHTFSEANMIKAGALITSLAAKHMARNAIDTADSRVAAITAAKEVYAQRIAVKDQTPDATPATVRTKFTN